MTPNTTPRPGATTWRWPAAVVLSSVLLAAGMCGAALVWSAGQGRYSFETLNYGSGGYNVQRLYRLDRATGRGDLVTHSSPEAKITQP